MADDTRSDRNEHAAALGSLGASKGGLARAQRLTPEERRLIAVQAAEKRWGRNVPVAEYEGVLEIAGMIFQCAVLSDETRVLTETAFMKTMGIYRSGALSVRREEATEGGVRIPLSLAFKNLRPFVEKHLGEVHVQPLVFRTKSGNVAAGGIPAAIIPKICEIWIDADRAGVLGPRQKEIAARADLLLRGLAHVGITALVDAATGYEQVRRANDLSEILQKFIARELRKWVRAFPPEFYQELYRLKGWDLAALEKGNAPKPIEVGRLTDDLVYKRMAPGVRDELKRLTPRSEKGYLKNKLHQRLTEDIGSPKLEKHLSVLVALMQVSDSFDDFQRKVNRVLPRYDKTLELPLND